MKKINYTYLSASHKPDKTAQVRTVLLPIAAKSLGEGKPIEQYHERLREIHRARIMKLWEHDRTVFRTKTDTDEATAAFAEQVVNCKPFAIRTHPVTKYTCGKPRLCLYCWARQVVPAMFWPLWRSAGKGRTLLWRTTYHTISPERAYLGRDRISEYRHRQLDLFPESKMTSRIGSFTLAVAMPANKANLKQLDRRDRGSAEERGVISVRTLVMTDGSFRWDQTDVPVEERAKWKHQTLDNAETIYNVTKAVAWYPWPLLRGDIGVHAELLRRYAKLQLFRRTGQFKPE